MNVFISGAKPGYKYKTASLDGVIGYFDEVYDKAGKASICSKFWILF